MRRLYGDDVCLRMAEIEETRATARVKVTGRAQVVQRMCGGWRVVGKVRHERRGSIGAMMRWQGHLGSKTHNVVVQANVRIEVAERCQDAQAHQDDG